MENEKGDPAPSTTNAEEDAFSPDIKEGGNPTENGTQEPSAADISSDASAAEKAVTAPEVDTTATSTSAEALAPTNGGGQAEMNAKKLKDDGSTDLQENEPDNGDDSPAAGEEDKAKDSDSKKEEWETKADLPFSGPDDGEDEDDSEGYSDDESDDDDGRSGIRYDASFLLSFQNNPQCQLKPDKLPALNIIKGNESMQMNHGSGRRGGRDRGRKKGGGGGRKGGRNNQPAKSKSKNEANLPPVVPLKQSENRWVRPSVAGAEESKTDVVLRNANAILNKLTKEKFDILSDRLINVGIDTPDILDGIIDLTFDKATSEPKFALMYAELCVKLSKEAPEFEDAGKKITFRRRLLNKCQQEFMEKEKELDASDLTAEEAELQAKKIKRRYLGNVGFIGELYTLRMLQNNVIIDCVIRLFGKEPIPDVDNLESLCKLLTKTGKRLDNDQTGHQFVLTVFDKLKDLAVCKELEARYRFMVKDLMELHENNWIPRNKSDGPKTIAEVHEEAKREDMKNEQQSRALARSMDSGLGRRAGHSRSGGGGGGGGGGGSRRGDDDWEVIGGRGSRKGGGGGGGGKSMSPSSGGWETVSGGGGGGRSGRRGRDRGNVRDRGGKRPDPWRSQGAAGGRRADRTRSRDNGKDRDKTASGGSRGSMNPFAALSSKDTSDRGFSSGDGRQDQRREQLLQSAPPSLHEKEEEEEESAVPKLTQEQAERKIKALLEEFWTINDEDEAVECVKDMKTDDYHPEVINQMIIISLEKKEAQRDMSVKLSRKLIEDVLADGSAEKG